MHPQGLWWQNSDSRFPWFSEGDVEGVKFAVHILKASGAFWYLYGPATIKLTCSEECVFKCVYMAKWGMQAVPLSSEKV